MPSGQQLIHYVLAFLFIIQSCGAIRCYYCNSANNSACVDVRQYEEYNLIPIVECEAAVPSNAGVKFFCRKIVQTILHAHGSESELRVTRGCGWMPHHSPCYRADNEDHTETVCQCHTDECNVSARNKPTAILSTMAAILSVTVARKLHFLLPS